MECQKETKWSRLDLPEIEFLIWKLDSEATVTPSQIPTMTCFQDIFESQFWTQIKLGVQSLLCQQQLGRK